MSNPFNLHTVVKLNNVDKKDIETIQVNKNDLKLMVSDTNQKCYVTVQSYAQQTDLNDELKEKVSKLQIMLT